jgi:uncharacterized SAM-binding protein YcdF (DUF218 family)
MLWPLLPLTGAALALGLGARVHRFGRRAPELPTQPRIAVVLGALVFPDGTPSDALRGRVAVGLELLARGHASALLFSGGTPDARPAEAVVARDLALAAGAPADRLLLETRSRSTFENAREVAALLAARDEREVIVVTCDFHLLRATAHFRAQGLRVFPVASRRALSTGQRLAVTAKETLGLLRRPWLIR